MLKPLIMPLEGTIPEALPPAFPRSYTVIVLTCVPDDPVHNRAPFQIYQLIGEDHGVLRHVWLYPAGNSFARKLVLQVRDNEAAKCGGPAGAA